MCICVCGGGGGGGGGLLYRCLERLKCSNKLMF